MFFFPSVSFFSTCRGGGAGVSSSVKWHQISNIRVVKSNFTEPNETFFESYHRVSLFSNSLLEFALMIVEELLRFRISRYFVSLSPFADVETR